MKLRPHRKATDINNYFDKNFEIFKTRNESFFYDLFIYRIRQVLEKWSDKPDRN